MGPMLGKAFDLAVLGSAGKPEEPAAIKVTPAAAVPPETVARSTFVTGQRSEVVSEKPVLVTARAPDQIVQAVPPPFSWRKTMGKVVGQTLVVVWSVVLPLAADALLDAAVRPGFLEGLGLPPSVPVPFVYLLLGALRDYRRHKRTPSEERG